MENRTGKRWMSIFCLRPVFVWPKHTQGKLIWNDTSQRLKNHSRHEVWLICRTKPYPGDPAPRLDTAADITHDSCCVTRISLATHTGTHVDAEAHVIHGGKRLGDYPLTAFSGLARVADLRGLSVVDASALDSIESCDWLLLCTGQSEKWGSEEYFGTEPLFTEAFVKAAARIARKGIGLDCSGLDREGVALHCVWFSSGGGLMVENLTDLEMLLSESQILFAAYPLKLAAGDGAPVRAVAVLG